MWICELDSNHSEEVSQNGGPLWPHYEYSGSTKGSNLSPAENLSYF